MVTESNLLDSNIEHILTAVLEDGPEELLIINPAADAIEDLVDVATAYEGDLPSMYLLGAEDILKDVFGDFILASNAADLIDEDALELRTVDDVSGNSLLLTPDTAISVVTVGDVVGGLSTEDDSFVEAAFEGYHERWEDAEPFKLRTPPITRVRSTLREEIGDQAEQDFNAVLASLETARGDGEGLDEVTISLLVAARNEALLYDISKWGEDVGLASKATFSRTKTRLEDMGLLDTEKVPIDVGRPRLRLKFGDDRLREADTDQLASVTQSLLN